MDILLDSKNKYAQEFLINRKIQDGRHSGVKCPKSTKFDPTNHILARRGTLISFIKFGQILALTYYLTFKQVCTRINQLAQNPRWPPEVKGPKSTKFDPTNHILARHLVPVYQIWTKFCIDILLEPSNKPAQQFLIYRKI